MNMTLPEKLESLLRSCLSKTPLPDVEAVDDLASHILVGCENFWIWSGSSKPNQHHYGDGGLAAHTIEVLELCKTNADAVSFNDGFHSHDAVVFGPVLFLAALYHDYGKMFDYAKVDGVWASAPHKRDIHHISRSAIEFSVLARKFNLRPYLEREVVHCILSHHGRREWGSPVAPRTAEAWMLHLCDGISARMCDWKTLDVLEHQRKP